MDWGTVSIIVTIVITVGTFAWGIISHVQNRKTSSNEEVVQSIEELQKWKGEVTLAIEQLRQEIDHVKEISDLKDAAAKEQLARLEAKMDELIGIVIRWVDKS